MSAPITAAEMAGVLRRAVNARLGPIAGPQDAGAFELTTPATGQRFRVTVTEVAGWSDRMDRELAVHPGGDAVTWAGEPAQCRCTRRTVATLAETLYCPYAWLEVPGTGWVHTRWLRVTGGAR